MLEMPSTLPVLPEKEKKISPWSKHILLLFTMYIYVVTQTVSVNFSFVRCNFPLISCSNVRMTQMHWVLSIMPKIPEISVGIQMEKSVSVSSDRNIRDHLWRWSTYFCWNISTEIRRSILDKPVLCPN